MGADQRGGAGAEQEGLHEALQGARRDRQGQEGRPAGRCQEKVTLTQVVRLLEEAVTGRWIIGGAQFGSAWPAYSQ